MRLNRSSNRRSGRDHRPPTGAVWSASAVPAATPYRRPATIHQYSPVPPTLAVPYVLEPAGPLRHADDFPVCPRTTTGPPPHPAVLDGRRVNPLTPTWAAGLRREPRDGSHVHHQPIDEGGGQLYPCGFATATPQAFTVTSRPATSTGPGVPHPDMRGWVRAALQPRSTGLELADSS